MAAEQGHSGALFNLGAIYEGAGKYRRGPKYNPRKAAELYEKAIDIGGDSFACYRLARMLRNGIFDWPCCPDQDFALWLQMKSAA
jgi:TPR repeat protein